MEKNRVTQPIVLKVGGEKPKSMKELNMSKKETSFYITLLNLNLDNLVNEGLTLAKKFLPHKKFFEPTISFVMDKKPYNAKIPSRTEIFINIAFLYKNYYTKKNFEKILKFIKSMVAHEACHIYLSQIKRSKERNIYLNGIFTEGLATFVESVHMEQHYTYLSEIKTWFEYLDIILQEKQDKDILKKMCFNPTLLKYNQYLIKIYKNGNFELLAKKIFFNKNGPLYHIGYFMWLTNLEFYGLKKFKNIIYYGSLGFFLHYNYAAMIINSNKKRYSSIISKLGIEPYIFSKPKKLRTCNYSCSQCIYKLRKKCQGLIQHEG